MKSNLVSLIFRPNLKAMKEFFHDLSSFAVDDGNMEGMSLVDTIKAVKPNILIGKLLFCFQFSVPIT